MPPLAPLRVVSAANAFLGLGEEPGTHPGRMIDTFLREAGRPIGSRWDVAFINHVGYWALFDVGAEYSPWPVPRTADERDLVAFAKEREILRDAPELGDLALIAGAAKESISRVGIVVETHGGRIVDGGRFYTCTTIEGNAGPHGRSGGQHILKICREYEIERGDAFIRWADLDPRNAIGRADRYAGRSMRRPTMWRGR